MKTDWKKRIEKIVTQFDSPEAAAAALKISVQTLWRWRKGHHAPRSRVVLARIEEVEGGAR